MNLRTVPGKTCLLALILLCGAWCLDAQQANAQTAHLAYIEHLYETREKSTRGFIMEEMRMFLRWYPDGENAARATYLLGRIHRDQGDRSEAAATLLKAALVYTGTASGQQAHTEVRNLVIKEKHFGDHRQAWLELADGERPDGPLEDRWYAYLVAIDTLDDDDLYGWLIAESIEFLDRFPLFVHNDHIILNMAQAYERDRQWKPGVATYFKLERLFVQSQFVPYSRLHRGTLYYKELDNREAALRILDGLLADFPGDEYAPEAQFLTGEVLDKRFKDSQGAVDRYLGMHRAYPNSPLTVSALLRAAKLQEEKLKDYGQAIATYNLIADVYANQPDADRSLGLAAKIYEDRLKDYNNGIDHRVRMAVTFPESRRTVDNLMKAGDLAEGKLKDYRRAIDIYRIVAKDFALSNRAKDAVKKIESLEKKLAEQ